LHPCLNIVIEKYNNNELTTSKTRKDIEKLVWLEIKTALINIIATTNTKNVFIAVDGVAPLGKIHQQRQRRYKYKTEDYHDICPMSIELTPGSSYMKRLHILLKKYCTKHNYIYSSCYENDEGEHKLIHYIRKIKTIQNVVIYGLDADLLFLSLTINHNTVVMREKQYFDNIIDTQNTYNYVSINTLKNKIKSFNIPVNDFIILCFLIGNDFIPSILSLHIKKNGISHLIKAYTIVNTPLTINNTVNIITLKNIFIELQKLTHEHNYFKYNHKNISNFGNKYNYYKYYLNSSASYTHLIPDMVNQYISSIEWIYQYYFNECICKEFSYKYYAPPLISDIIQYYPSNITFNKTSLTMTPTEQLIIVIPTHLLNKVIDEEDIVNSIISHPRFINIQHLFPNTFSKDVYKEYIEYKQTIKLPFVDYTHYIHNIRGIIKNDKLI